MSPFLSLSTRPNHFCHHLRGFFYQTQPKKSILILQNLFFDSNLKPRFGRLTLKDLITLTPKNMTVGAEEGEHEDPRRRPKPTISGQHEVTHGQQLHGSSSPPLSLSLSPHCVHPSPRSISLWSARMGSSFFLLPSYYKRKIYCFGSIQVFCNFFCFM